MRFRIALGKWEDGGLEMPTVVTACNEYDEESWAGTTPDWYADAVDEHRANNGEVREVILTVPDGVITALFDVPTVVASVVEDA